MSVDDEIREVILRAAPEFAARLREELGRPRMIQHEAVPVARRLVLDAERAGELPIYRVGQARLIDEGELYEWIRRTVALWRAPAEAPMKSGS